MSTCWKCGTPITDEDEYCPKCGAPVYWQQKDDSNLEEGFETSFSKNEESQETREEYAGKVIKCPNCGQPLKPFMIRCPSCGYELREAQPSYPLREFFEKINNAKSESQRLAIIQNFPVPNTKEDLFEFLIMAAANTGKEKTGQESGKAWEAKLEQCYQKAKLSFSNEPEFSQIQKIYDDEKKEIHSVYLTEEREEKEARKRQKKIQKENRSGNFRRKSCAWIVCLIAIGAILLIPFVRNSILIYKNDSTIKEVEKLISNGDFKSARSLTDEIVCDSLWPEENKKKYDRKRESLINEILQGELASGDTVEVPVNSDDLEGRSYIDVISMMKKIGFRYVESSPVDDLIIGFLSKKGDVKEVTIDGDSDFTDKAIFASDSQVIVYYHTFRNK